MKRVHLVCPTCGAQLDVDMATGQARCRFCKEIFQINDGTPDDAMSDAEQMGYDFERGRQRANVEFTQGFADRVAEARNHMPAMDPEPVYVPEPVYYENTPTLNEQVIIPTWLLIVLWLAFPPLGLFATVFVMVRKARDRGGTATAAGVLTTIMLIWMMIVVMSVFL